MTDRLHKRRGEILDQLGEDSLAAETARGSRATADEALRWALTALQNRLVP